MSQISATDTGWSDAAITRLLDRSLCPVCGSAQLIAGRCPACRSDVSGQPGADLWRASQVAAEALRVRDAVRRRVPQVPYSGVKAPESDAAAVTPASSPASVAHADAAMPSAPRNGGAAPTRANSATLQSLLATAGAALFAVAAIVFTFFNPELADRPARGWIVFAVSLVFLGGAWLLARRELTFSAEAVGALGVIFLALDVQAAADAASAAVHPWVVAGLAAAVAGGVLMAAGLRAGIRVWLWSGLVGLAISPAMLGWATGDVQLAAIGQLAAAAVAAGLTTALPRMQRRAGTGAWGLRAESGTLTALQFALSMTAVVSVGLTGPIPAMVPVFALAAAHALFAARTPLSAVWSTYAGVLVGASAVVTTIASLDGAALVLDAWLPLVVAATAVVFVATALVPLPPRVSRGLLAGGVVVVFSATLLAPVMAAASVGAQLALRFLSAMLRESDGFATAAYAEAGYLVAGVVALAIGALGFGCFAWGIARRSVQAAAAARAVAVAFGALAVLALAAQPWMPAAAGVGIALVAATLVAVLSRRADPAIRVLLVVAGILSLLVAAMLTWLYPALVPLAGTATVAVLSVFIACTRSNSRPGWVAATYGYALLVLAGCLGNVGIDGVAQLCVTASAGLAGAIIATYLTRVGARSWQAVLIVAALPFAIAVAQVTVQRSGWTALSTAVMFALAFTLTLTRRPGLTLLVRTAAAALLVPTLAVVAVCLGAEILAQSGSPVVLPVIAVLVALVLPNTDALRRLLIARGRGARAAEAARLALEASTLVTAAITVGLSFAREAAGLSTACLVLVILGAGFIVTGALGGRRYGWWLAGASFTGALWSVWGMAGVTLVEAYLLPPALGAAAIAVVLTVRGVPATPLFAAGLAAAVAPLVALAALEPPTGGAPSPRVLGLIAAALLLLMASAAVSTPSGPRIRRLRVLRTLAVAAAATAALAGTVQAVRWGLGVDSVAGWAPSAVFVAALAASAVAAALVAMAAATVRSATSDGGRQSWLAALPLVAFTVGVWPAIERDWFVIWAMWMLMIALLAGMVVAASRVVRGRVAPPAVVVFALAFVTAVVAWSPRDLRVEWFSLPLGVFLLWAGLSGMHQSALGVRGDLWARKSLRSWPARWSGSWGLLAPGLIVMLSASVVATFTDPLTWRAVLVMVIALAAILLGSSGRLAAPFVIGLVVLPIENLFVFAVQLGRGIEAMPWWITLAVMGAVLLIIAVTSERRIGEGRGVAVRVRDLR